MIKKLGYKTCFRYFQDITEDKTTDKNVDQSTCPSQVVTALLNLRDGRDEVFWHIAQSSQDEVSSSSYLDKTGWTPLMVAVVCRAGMPVVELMAKRGGRVDDKNVLGVSAVDLASFVEDGEVSNYLKDVCETSLYDVAGEASGVFLEAASRHVFVAFSHFLLCLFIFIPAFSSIFLWAFRHVWCLFPHFGAVH